MIPELDQRPLLLCLAGPNGAGKSTLYYTYFQDLGVRFINADILARELKSEAYEAARLAAQLREQLVASRESFVFETVLSDPVGEKVAFLEEAAATGYNVVLVFVGINDPNVSDERVAIRVLQGEHDVPREKLESRFPRTMANLRRAIPLLPRVYVYDNSDLTCPYQLVARYESGIAVQEAESKPDWFVRAVS